MVELRGHRGRSKAFALVNPRCVVESVSRCGAFGAVSASLHMVSTNRSIKRTRPCLFDSRVTQWHHRVDDTLPERACKHKRSILEASLSLGPVASRLESNRMSLKTDSLCFRFRSSFVSCDALSDFILASSAPRRWLFVATVGLLTLDTTRRYESRILPTSDEDHEVQYYHLLSFFGTSSITRVLDGPPSP